MDITTRSAVRRLGPYSTPSTKGYSPDITRDNDTNDHPVRDRDQAFRAEEICGAANHGVHNRVPDKTGQKEIKPGTK